MFFQGQFAKNIYYNFLVRFYHNDFLQKLLWPFSSLAAAVANLATSKRLFEQGQLLTCFRWHANKKGCVKVIIFKAFDSKKDTILQYSCIREGETIIFIKEAVIILEFFEHKCCEHFKCWNDLGYFLFCRLNTQLQCYHMWIYKNEIKPSMCIFSISFFQRLLK